MTDPYNTMLKDLKSFEEKQKVLKELDFFVLDNSMRETTVGQLRGHTLENKWEIYDQVKKVGFEHTIVATFSSMTRVGDDFVKQLKNKGEDMSKKYAFCELTDKVDKDNVPTDDIPITLKKCKDLGIQNPIFELDMAYFDYNYEKYTVEKICAIIDKRIEYVRNNISKDAKILINLRDFSDSMLQAPERVFAVVKHVSSYRPKISGLMYEEMGGNFPDKLGIYTRSVRNIMKECGYADGHLLIHVHHQWGLSDSIALECLANGANGVWAGICDEGAAIGHASSCLTLMNLIRLGNTKVLKKYKCTELRNAAIKMTKIVTGNPPPPKTPVVGERALDRVFGFPAYDPDVVDQGFTVHEFFGEEAVMRISTMADADMIRDNLVHYFGDDPKFNLDIASKMKELMLTDLKTNRKEEYQSPFGLSVLFDRAGGQMTAKMSEVIEEVKLSSLNIQGLIKQIRKQWDEWDRKDNNQIDDMLDFDSFYGGFLGNYFGCHRCLETRKALKALDMDSDGMVDWREFLVYLKWAGNAYPKTPNAEELLRIAFNEGLLPAMQDVLLIAAEEKRWIKSKK